MIVIAAQTEYKLEEDLHRYDKEHEDQRCFLLKFSQTDICKDTLFERCLGLLNDIPSYYFARVYLFQDKDIVIMMGRRRCAYRSSGHPVSCSQALPPH